MATYLPNGITMPSLPTGEQLNAVKINVVSKSSSYLVGAVALTTALAFNSAVKGTIDHYYPFEKGTLTATWMYAIITVLLLLILVYFTGVDSDANAGGFVKIGNTPGR